MTRKSPRIDRTCIVCGETFTGTARAKYCPGCRHGNATKSRRKYDVDARVKQLLEDRYDSSIRGRVAEIATELGWPTWAVKQAARRLGLTRPWPADRRNWTPEEIAVLNRWVGLRSAGWIARRLGRGETSVVLKMRRLGLNRRVRNGYTIADVARCFGVDHHTVDRWVAKGWLVGRRQKTLRANDILRIQERAILTFVLDHREEFSLAKVDQGWFLDLVLDGPRTARQLVAPSPQKAPALQTWQERAEEAADRKAATPAEVARRAKLAARLRELHLAPLRTGGKGGNP